MYQAMAHTKSVVENANLKGLIQALTLKTVVVVSWASTRHTSAKARHSSPYQKRGSLRCLSVARKSIMRCK